mgnify:FL=1
MRNPMGPDGVTNFSRLLRDAICYNQGAFIQYYYRGHALHTILKNSLLAPHDIRAIHEHKSDLDAFLAEKLRDVAMENFLFLTRYFSGDGEPAPGFRLSANYPVDDKTGVFDLFQHGTRLVASTDLDDHAGYRHVAATGTYFIADDRSMLIVPVTLTHNSLDDDFTRTIQQRYPNFRRVIFAYLGFEQLTTSQPYFNHETDVDVGYMFADLLSLFFFTRWNLTVLSVAYGSASRIASRMEDNNGI